jgi:DNA-directed RNA polymerase specialized sigma24 family protein
VVERYQAGASLEDLAILCRCSASKVRSLLVKAGVEIRPKGRRITISGPL